MREEWRARSRAREMSRRARHSRALDEPTESRIERRRAAEHVARRAAREHRAVREHEHAIRERREQLEILLDDEDRDAAVAQRAEGARELRGGLGIELRGGLVEYEQRRVERERGGERHALQLAARELAREPQRERRCVRERERRIDARANARRCERLILRTDGDFFLDGLAELRELRRRIGEDEGRGRTTAEWMRDRAVDRRGERAAEQSRGGECERALPRADVPRDADDLAARDIERDVAQRDAPVVGDGAKPERQRQRMRLAHETSDQSVRELPESPRDRRSEREPDHAPHPSIGARIRDRRERACVARSARTRAHRARARAPRSRSRARR